MENSRDAPGHNENKDHGESGSQRCGLQSESICDGSNPNIAAVWSSEQVSSLPYEATEFDSRSSEVSSPTECDINPVVANTNCKSSSAERGKETCGDTINQTKNITSTSQTWILPPPPSPPRFLFSTKRRPEVHSRPPLPTSPIPTNPPLPLTPPPAEPAGEPPEELPESPEQSYSYHNPLYQIANLYQSPERKSPEPQTMEVGRIVSAQVERIGLHELEKVSFQFNNKAPNIKRTNRLKQFKDKYEILNGSVSDSSNYSKIYEADKGNASEIKVHHEEFAVNKNENLDREGESLALSDSLSDFSLSEDDIDFSKLLIDKKQKDRKVKDSTDDSSPDEGKSSRKYKKSRKHDTRKKRHLNKDDEKRRKQRSCSPSHSKDYSKDSRVEKAGKYDYVPPKDLSYGNLIFNPAKFLEESRQVDKCQNFPPQFGSELRGRPFNKNLYHNYKRPYHPSFAQCNYNVQSEYFDENSEGYYYYESYSTADFFDDSYANYPFPDVEWDSNKITKHVDRPSSSKKKKFKNDGSSSKKKKFKKDGSSSKKKKFKKDGSSSKKKEFKKDGSIPKKIKEELEPGECVSEDEDEAVDDKSNLPEEVEFANDSGETFSPEIDICDYDKLLLLEKERLKSKTKKGSTTYEDYSTHSVLYDPLDDQLNIVPWGLNDLGRSDSVPSKESLQSIDTRVKATRGNSPMPMTVDTLKRLSCTELEKPTTNVPLIQRLGLADSRKETSSPVINDEPVSIALDKSDSACENSAVSTEARGVVGKIEGESSLPKYCATKKVTTTQTKLMDSPNKPSRHARTAEKNKKDKQNMLHFLSNYEPSTNETTVKKDIANMKRVDLKDSPIRPNLDSRISDLFGSPQGKTNNSPFSPNYKSENPLPRPPSPFCSRTHYLRWYKETCQFRKHNLPVKYDFFDPTIKRVIQSNNTVADLHGEIKQEELHIKRLNFDPPPEEMGNCISQDEHKETSSKTEQSHTHISPKSQNIVSEFKKPLPPPPPPPPSSQFPTFVKNTQSKRKTCNDGSTPQSKDASSYQKHSSTEKTVLSSVLLQVVRELKSALKRSLTEDFLKEAVVTGGCESSPKRLKKH